MIPRYCFALALLVAAGASVVAGIARTLRAIEEVRL